MQKIISGLEELAHSIKRGSDLQKSKDAIESVRKLIKDSKEKTSGLQQLDQELSVWQSKLPAIFKEPVGREGMSKHALFWAEQLRNACQTN